LPPVRLGWERKPDGLWKSEIGEGIIGDGPIDVLIDAYKELSRRRETVIEDSPGSQNEWGEMLVNDQQHGWGRGQDTSKLCVALGWTAARNHREYGRIEVKRDASPTIRTNLETIGLNID
jgi:hypothetical protein